MYMYIFKVFFIFVCKTDKRHYHSLMALRVTHTDAEFLTCNQEGPWPFHFSILFQHSWKGSNKLYSSLTEIKVCFLLLLMYSCGNKAQPKYLVGRLSLQLQPIKLLFKVANLYKNTKWKNILICLTQKKSSNGRHLKPIILRQQCVKTKIQ